MFFSVLFIVLWAFVAFVDKLKNLCVSQLFRFDTFAAAARRGY